jgi:hypothetical protein
MTLTWFHIVFITISMLMGIAIGVWAFFNHFPILALGSLASSAGLCLYGNYFLNKVRKAGLV